MRTLSAISVTCLLSFLCVSTVPAQWVQTNGPYGGSTHCLAVAGTNLIAGTDSGVFVSTDNGNGWFQPDTGLTNTSINCLASSGTTLFAGTGEGVLCSTNNGMSWRQRAFPRGGVRSLAVFETDLFALSTDNIWRQGGIFLSADSGASWTETGLMESLIFALAASGTNLLAGTYYGEVFLSTNNGTNWTRVDTGWTPHCVNSFTISGSNLFALTRCYSGFPLFDNYSVRAAANSVSGTNLSFSFAGIFLSTDNGTSWRGIGLAETDVTALSVSGTSLFAGTDIGVFLSTDNGANWTSVSDGLTDSGISSLAICNSNLFAGAGGAGVWRRPISEMIPELNSTIEIMNGWNLVSVPLTVENYARRSLFPTAASAAYAFDSSGYVARDPLENRPGYFLKFNGAQSVTMTGLPRRSDSISVRAGWNIIGSISAPVATSTISSIPGGIVTSQFFGYDGAYDSADTIQPGRAYWVKVNQNGQLILSSSSRQASSSRIRIVATAEKPPSPPDAVVSQVREGMPSEFALEQNYPNPFNSISKFGFRIAKWGMVELTVFDLLGREVATLVDEPKEPGVHTVRWDASGVSSGVYLYRLRAGAFVQTRRMLLLR